MKIDAYPLQWPGGWKRTPATERTRARFNAKETRRQTFADGTGNNYTRSKQLTIADAVGRVRLALQRFGFGDDDIVISSNLQLRLDGLPRSGQSEPGDPGVAVYWRDGGTPQAMAIDLYDRVADNLAAVAATIDAMRAIERHGGAEILNRAFAGFKALPGAGGSTPTMDLTLAAAILANYSSAHLPQELIVNKSAATNALRAARARTHPDISGDPTAWDNVETARKVLEQHHGGAL